MQLTSCDEAELCVSQESSLDVLCQPLVNAFCSVLSFSPSVYCVPTLLIL